MYKTFAKQTHIYIYTYIYTYLLDLYIYKYKNIICIHIYIHIFLSTNMAIQIVYLFIDTYIYTQWARASHAWLRFLSQVSDESRAVFRTNRKFPTN